MRPRFHARSIVAALLTTLILLLPGRARGGDIRVVVRTVSADDRLIFERVVGHTSDLPVKLHELREGALESDLAARLEKANALAEAGARVVVWFEHPSTAEVRLIVAVPEKDRVLVRNVGGTRPVHEVTVAAKSAVLEETALIVSTALYAVDADVAIGVSRQELLGPGTKADEAPALPALPPSPAREGHIKRTSISSIARPEAKTTSPPRAWRAALGVGWQLTVDGQSPWGARAGALSGGVEWRSYTLDLGLSIGLPSRIHDAFSSLEVSRHAAVATLGRVLFRTREWSFRAGVGGGVVLFSRTIAPNDPRLVPSAGRVLSSPLATVEGAVRYFATQRLGLMAVVGVDGVARPPTFAYEVLGVPVPNRTLWFFEPRASFFVFCAFR